MLKTLQTCNKICESFSSSVVDFNTKPIFLQRLCGGITPIHLVRSVSSNTNHVKVTIIGAAGKESKVLEKLDIFNRDEKSNKIALLGTTLKVRALIDSNLGKIGQPLSLMLKQSPLIDELCVHDILPTSGFAMELNHIDTNCRVTAFTGKDNFGPAMKNSKVVVLLAAAPETDLLTYEKMWSPNAQIIQEIVAHVARHCPKAFLAIGTNPVNSLVPMACEVLKKAGSFNPNTVFGITSLDTVRANTFVAQIQAIEPECVMIPIIGGHTEETIIPVLSHAKPKADFTNEELENVTMNVRKAQDNMLKLKPAESAPLTSAFASARFVISLVKAIRGYPEIMESAYVNSKVHPQLKYLSNPLLIGPNGISKNLGIPTLSEFESCMLDNAIPTLISDIKRGEKFVGVIDPPTCDPCDTNINAPRCPRNWCEFKKDHNKTV